MLLLTVFITLVLGSIIACIAGYSAYLVYIHRKYAHLPGPPIDSFFMGNVPQIRQCYKKKQFSHYLFLEWSQQYGPIFRIFLFHECVILVLDPAVIKEVLTKSKEYPKSLTYSKIYSIFGVRLFGTGLVTVRDYHSWSRKRSAVNPGFRIKALKMLMDQYNNTGDEWLEKLNEVADGKSKIRMMDYVSRATLDMVARLAFSMDTNSIADDQTDFPKALNNVLQGISLIFKDPFLRFRPSKRDFVKSVQKSVRYMRDIAKRVAENRIADESSGKNLPDDILALMLKYLHESPGIGIDDLLDDFVTVFVAGQETTANALSFCLCELGRNPTVLKKLQDEVDDVVGEKIHVTYDDVCKLVYMGQVINETLRLYPPAPGTSRTNTKDTELGGYFIPSGSQFIVSFFAMHRLPDFYKDPTKFYPERFNPDEPRTLYTYMPFSLGQRSCVGKQFALIEAKVLLTKFLQRFSFEVDMEQSFEILETSTLRPEDGSVMTLSPRASAC